VKVAQSLATRLAHKGSSPEDEESSLGENDQNESQDSDNRETDFGTDFGQDQGVDTDSEGESETSTSTSDHQVPFEENDLSESTSSQKEEESIEENESNLSQDENGLNSDSNSSQEENESDSKSNSGNSTSEQSDNENSEGDNESSKDGNTPHDGDGSNREIAQSGLANQNLDGSGDEDRNEYAGDSEPLSQKELNSQELSTPSGKPGDKEHSKTQESPKKGEVEQDSFQGELDSQTEKTNSDHPHECNCCKKQRQNVDDEKSDEHQGSMNASSAFKLTALEKLLNNNIKQSTKEDFLKNDYHSRTYDEHSFTGKPRKSPLVLQAIQRVVGGVNLGLKTDGFENWDGRKLIKALTVEQHKLLVAKYKRPPHKVYFFIDTNCKNCGNEHCSWCNYSEFAMLLIESTKKSEVVDVWSGSKCRPEYKEDEQKKYFKKHHLFHLNFEEWIRKENPEKGSTIVCWGELYNISFNKIKTKELLRDFNLIWLNSLDPKTNHFYQNWKWNGGKEIVEDFKQIGFKVFNGVDNTASFVRALNSI